MKAVSVIVVSLLLVFGGSAIAADGGKIYKDKCSMCHGPLGAGTMMAPPLKGSEFITKGKAEDIKKVVVEGRSGAAKKYPKITFDMPKLPMPDADLDALTSFLTGDLQK